MEPLNGHQFRVRSDGTTYGLPLVAVGHGSASAVRVYDGSAVKALVKIS